MTQLLIFLIIFIEVFGLNLSSVDLEPLLNFGEKKQQTETLERIEIESIASQPLKKAQAKKHSIQAENYLSLDWDSGKILASKKPKQVKSIASLTKLMTAVVALENMNRNDIITIPESVEKITGSKLWLTVGSEVTVSNLIKGALIKSANDCARAIEKGYDKKHSDGEFVKLMNEKAKELGMDKTNFKEATGLSEKNQSNLNDLSILTRYALRKPFIAQLVNTYKDTMTTVSDYQFALTNTNRLLRDYPEVFGIKTGYLEEAGQCLIAGTERNGQRILTIILGASDNNVRFWQTIELIDWTYSSYKW